MGANLASHVPGVTARKQGAWKETLSLVCHAFSLRAPVISGREPEIWEIGDQVLGSYQHPNFHRAMDKLFMIILFCAYSFTEVITKYKHDVPSVV